MRETAVGCTSWTVRGLNAGGSEVFRTRLDEL